MIAKSEIDGGLEFFSLEDYRQRAYECAEIINNTCIEAFEKINNLIFHNEQWKYTDIIPYYGKKNADEVFGTNVPPFTFSLMIIINYASLRDGAERFGVPQEYRTVQRERVHVYFNASHENHPDGILLSPFIWLVRLLSGRLVNIGRLQMEYFDDDGEKSIIHIHIPGGGRLLPDDVKASVTASVEFFKNVFGVKNAEFTCSSWLLSPQIVALCGEKSNIRAFYNMFDVEEGPSCLSGIFKFLYNIEWTDDYAALPEDTSLRKAVKAKLSAGDTFNTGIGIFKKELYQ